MTAMNVVHMRVKPGKEQEFIRLHNEFGSDVFPGNRNVWVTQTGDRSFVVVGEWDTMESLVTARQAMIGHLDKLRSILEDLGGGRGVTEPWSGEVAVHIES